MASLKKRLYWRECHKRRKQKDPEKYYYGVTRRNARRRGIPFDITLEQWRKFCQETEYIITKGKSSTSMTIDRIDPSKGYTIDNIRTLANGDNVRRMLMLRYHWDEEKREMVFWYSKDEALSEDPLFDENGDVIF